MPSKFENNLQKNLQSAKQNADNFVKYFRVDQQHDQKVQRRGVKRRKSEDDEEQKQEIEDKFEEVEAPNEIEYIEEIDDLCRLCAAKSETEMIQIFDECGELSADAQCIKLMPNIQYNDGLPQAACFNCLEKLHGCANIIDGFVANQRLFFN